jgi:hypothetical protein
MINFDIIVIWGYKIGNLNEYIHTHSWIHKGFYEGFSYLNYNTYWFDDTMDISHFDFSNTLFITMGDEENKNMPYRKDCYYILHNSNTTKFIDNGLNYMIIQVYTLDCNIKERELKRVYSDDPYQLYNLKDRTLYFPWATNLFPKEIENNITNIKFKKSNEVNFIGMMIEPWIEFSQLCQKKNLVFKSIGGFTQNKVSFDENKRLIQESFMAPALVCEWQKNNGYIPCRIFKNISYGKFGITNSHIVNNLFNNELIYDSNIEKLFDKAYDICLNDKIQYDILEKHMRFIANKHTYINRCQTMLDIYSNILIYSN